MTSLLLLLTALGVSHTAPEHPPDACALVTPREAAVLGVAGDPVAHGPDRDRGARRSTCTYRHGNVTLMVKVLEYRSAELAGNNLTEETVKAELDDQAAKVVLESGLGDRAYWATNTVAGVYVVLSGRMVVSIRLGADNFTPDNHQASLRKAMETALTRL
jgi:hypothetical protein